MHVHLREANWQPWARGIAIVTALIATPIVAALIWLVLIRNLV